MNGGRDNSPSLYSLRFCFFSVVTAWSENGPSTWILIRRMTRRRQKKKGEKNATSTKNQLNENKNKKQKNNKPLHQFFYSTIYFFISIFFAGIFFLFVPEYNSTYLNMHLLYGKRWPTVNCRRRHFPNRYIKNEKILFLFFPGLRFYMCHWTLSNIVDEWRRP